ncbi:hypothetical protein ACFL3B_01055, partial [Gemmatimonadota bacterium]
MKQGHYLNLHTDSPAGRGTTEDGVCRECAPGTAQPRPPAIPPDCRPVHSYEDIIPAYRETPIGELLAYHNLGV